MTSSRFWRWLTVATIAAFATTAATAPTSASAASCAPNAIGCTLPICTVYYGQVAPSDCAVRREYRTAGTGHVGWTYLNLNHCPSGMMCAAVYRDSMAAWSWTGSAWKPATLRQGWVYVYPYTGEWRWAWTQATGWVAVNSGRFELRGW